MRLAQRNAIAPIQGPVKEGTLGEGGAMVMEKLIDRKDLVRKQSAAQARTYFASAKLRHAEKAHPLIELAEPSVKDIVLDVATGWGVVAFAFAPLVRSVIGLDLTPEMVELAQRLAVQKGVSNVEFQAGDADELPFNDGTFDLVTCRAAFDHLSDPEKTLREMKRVLDPKGRIALYEFIAPADPERAHFYHAIENTRDPSHLWSSSIHEFEELFWKCGLQEQGKVVNLLKRDFDQWMSSVDADEETAKKVRTLLESSIAGDRAGLAPRIRGESLTFTRTCVAWTLIPRSLG